MAWLRHAKFWIIIGVLGLVALWLIVGTAFRDEEPTQATVEEEAGPTRVAVRQSKAQAVDRLLVLQGDLQPDQIVVLRAETGGQVLRWHVPRGAAVDAGELLVELEQGEREARLRQAEARLSAARQQLEATRKMVAEGYEPALQEELRQAEFEAAQAELAAIERELEHTRIRAPVAGRVDRRVVEQGDYVAPGGEVANIVDNDPLLATVQVPQHQIGRVSVGQPARVEVLRHGSAEGRVSFVSNLADPATRTFRVEVEVPNPESGLPAGTSAQVEIRTEMVPAHKVSPAILSLDDDGRVGVKTVTDDGRVDFHIIEPVRAERDGIWVAGLPERTHIITVGQGFVSAGEQVDPREEMAVADASEGTEPNR